MPKPDEKQPSQQVPPRDREGGTAAAPQPRPDPRQAQLPHERAERR